MEEIIIDGVDVSKCALLCVNNKCKVTLEHRELHPKDNLIITSCEGNNCYYKQLQKALKEKELLEKVLEERNCFISKVL